MLKLGAVMLAFCGLQCISLIIIYGLAVVLSAAGMKGSALFLFILGFPCGVVASAIIAARFAISLGSRTK